jgi:hypothetical protein
MGEKRQKLEAVIWNSLKKQRKHSPKGPFLYDNAETLKAALDNARPVTTSIVSQRTGRTCDEHCHPLPH